MVRIASKGHNASIDFKSSVVILQGSAMMEGGGIAGEFMEQP